MSPKSPGSSSPGIIYLFRYTYPDHGLDTSPVTEPGENAKSGNYSPKGGTLLWTCIYSFSKISPYKELLFAFPVLSPLSCRRIYTVMLYKNLTLLRLCQCICGSLCLTCCEHLSVTDPGDGDGGWKNSYRTNKYIIIKPPPPAKDDGVQVARECYILHCS